MKTERNIFVAFLLNLAFSLFELAGGFLTGSIAIASDAIHDLGDAAGIGISWFLERKSKRQPDETYTYGYARFSVLGSVITTLILLIGSGFVICNAVGRLFSPKEIHYDGMILFAIVGVCVNFLAAFLTREGDSLNQKAVNLHMLEDVLGWAIVLVGAVVMRFTDFALLDALLSIGVALFIFINAAKTLKAVIDLFLEKAPIGLSIQQVKENIMRIDGVEDVHHIHIRSIDGHRTDATMHVVTNDAPGAKERIRESLKKLGVSHITIETEAVGEHCHSIHCHTEEPHHCGGHHHHHHHHH